MPSRDDKSSKPGDIEKGLSGSQEIKVFYDLMVEEGLEFLEVKEDDFRLRLSRQRSAEHTAPASPAVIRRSSPAPTPASMVEASVSSHQPAITSPLAGVFYRSSSPSAAVFVKEGDIVDPGQTLCIIEAMKVMNEIKSDKRCKILRIAVENSRPVTAGQTLFVVEAA